MSERYNKSDGGQNTFSSQFRPSGYSDFSSNSYSSSSFDSGSPYNYDNDSSYRKYDDFQSSPANQQNKPQYENNSARQSAYHTDSFSQFDRRYENDRNYQNLQSHDKKDRQAINMNPQQSVNSYSQGDSPHVTKPFQRYTVRDVIQLPLQRQGYLKSLSIPQLKIQPQYQVILKRPVLTLGIAGYYQKNISDPQFNSKVKSLKRGKDVKQMLWMTSLFTYVYLTGKLGGLPQKFKGFVKGRFHFMIPVALTGLMILQKRLSILQMKQFVQDKNNQGNVNVAVRSFICLSSRKQRVEAFALS